MLNNTEDNYKVSPSQLSRYARGSYFDRTSRPVYALVYLLGFIVFYELGTIFISPETLSESLSRTQIRVISFVWIQNILDLAGMSERMIWIAPPFVVIIILAALQITSRASWSVRFRDFIWMTFECILFAVPLIVLSLALNCSAAASPDGASAGFEFTVCSQVQETGPGNELTQPAEVVEPPRPLMVDIVTGIGAGIYEELVFRLILICLLMLLFQNFLEFSRTWSIVFSILISAVLFSAHHHIFFVNGRFGLGEAFSFARFAFRTLAGIYFAALFALRGFAIAAGTHAFYDIIAALLNAFLLVPQD